MTKPLQDRIEALEQNRLRTSNTAEFGTTARATGNTILCTYHGWVWICLPDTEAKPGRKLAMATRRAKRPRRQDAKASCMTPDDKNVHCAHADQGGVRFSIVDEYILLRLDTAEDQTWWRLTPRKFHRLGSISERRSAPDHGALADGNQATVLNAACQIGDGGSRTQAG